MNKMHRAQILLEPEQHQSLADIARQEGRSISGLVREAIRIWLAKRERDAQRERQGFWTNDQNYCLTETPLFLDVQKGFWSRFS